MGARLPSFDGSGRVVFAAILVAMGAWGVATGRLAPIWEQVPKHWPARQAVAVVSALVALVGGAGLLWRRSRAFAAAGLALYFLAWLVVFKSPAAIKSPATAVVWESCGETLVPLAAAWAIFCEAAGGRGRRLGALTGDAGLRAARAVYGLAMIFFGVAHLAYVKMTASLVPGWIPAHVAWVYFTGITYLAAGVAMIVGVLGGLAAILSAVQIAIFTLLVWCPPVLAGGADDSSRSEFVLSWVLTAAAWVVAESYGSRSGRLAWRRGRR